MAAHHGPKKIFHISASTVLNRLLRKTTKKNTWIFVADTSFRLYVGIKQTGTFQHSSFLHGGRISAAGLIRIRDGQLRSLSPLSGHYRPPATNFRKFIHTLKEEGADISRMSTSKSYAVLLGLETYANLTKGKKKGKSAAWKTVGKGEKAGTYAIATGVDISKGAVKSEEAGLKEIEEKEKAKEKEKAEEKAKEKEKEKEGKGVKVKKESGWWKLMRKCKTPV